MILARRVPMSKLKYIKTILVLLLKAYLVYLWINFVETFIRLLYDIYVLKVYSVEHFGLFLFFLFGNICCILWLVLWCKRLPPAFNKPKIYYKIKVYSIIRDFIQKIFINNISFFVYKKRPLI